MKSRIYAIVYTLIFVLLAPSFGQFKTVIRKYVPIIQQTGGTSLEGLVIDQWHAYRYDASADRWSPVLYQVDEKSPDGKFNKQEFIDGVIGPGDDLLFMPEDLGDQALAAEWLDGVDPAQSARIEILFTDPVDGGLGWAYLYKNTEAGTLPGHFSYVQAPASMPAADTVVTDSYKIGHSKDGWIDYASLSIAPAMDLLDRLKLRLAGDPVVPFVADYVIDENTIQPKVDDPKGPVGFIPGPIRAFQDRRDWFRNPIDGTKSTADYQMHYFPYSFRITLDKFPLSKNWLALLGVQSLRISLDLSANSHEMTFYSTNNPGGFPIDGSGDAVVIPLDKAEKTQWVMASGDKGSILLVMEMPNVKNGQFDLYYRDDKNGGTNDNTDDTGDGASYSDMGLWVHVDSGNLDADFLSVKYNAYFIDTPNLSVDFGNSLVQWESTPLEMSVIEQQYNPATSVSRGDQPDDFELVSAYPNPFKLGGGDLQFSFKAKVDEPVYLAVFNVLGQKIAERSGVASQRQGLLRWDGRSVTGEPVSAGTYFYQLVVSGKTFGGKIVITKN